MPSAASSGMQAPASPVDTLAPRRRGDALIARPGLLSTLDAFSTRNLTLLSAPCGYGKTALLATWSSCTAEATAWVTLEATDWDRARFWRTVAASVERVRPGTTGRAARLLGARGTAPEVAVRELLVDLAAAGPLTIILDDLHLVENSECFDLLGYAVEHLPSGVRIVAGTRADPPLALGRLRARGLLGEIRARDLAFTAEEAREVLVRMEGLELDDDEVSLLVERTEGWPVAVYLTALWLRDQEDPRMMVRELAAGRQFVGEYLTDEIVASLDLRTRTFLVRTSVLSYLSAPLCDAVLGRSDSAEILREISSSNLLVAPLEQKDDWFRVHGLFRELLRLELERDEPWAVVELHRRAATWLREHGFLVGAVAHAADAGEHDEAAAMISDAWEDLVNRGDGETLIRLVEYLPLDVVIANPELSAGSALATYLARRPVHERSRWLAITARSRRESPATWSPRAGLIASLARAIAVDGDLGAAATHARRALRLIAREHLHVGELSALSALAYALYLAGAHEAAGEHASRAVAAPEAADRVHGVVRSLGVLALIAADEGRIDESAAKAERALELARENGLATAAVAHVAHLARARVLLAKRHLRAAEGAAELGERLCRMPDPSVPHAFALLVLAEVRTRSGQLESAAALIRDAKREVEMFSDAGSLPRTLGAARRSLREARKLHSASTEPLSPAEHAVLRVLATGLSQRAIGRELYLSVNTIKTHSRSIYRKLGVASRADAVRRANALGLLSRG